jgi:mannose/fructose/N-acetylgalactosamine-specific phosphotransferase system component IIC
LLWGLLFFVSDFICGDLRIYPWGLLLVLIFGHVAPEMGIGGAINFVWLGNASVIAAALFSTQIAPILGALFGGQTNPEPESSLVPVLPPA